MIATRSVAVTVANKDLFLFKLTSSLMFIPASE
jgi:hypothetical protein